ncbi:hypothetical protein ACTD5D_40200 [Nocardia takedensis]|uniref:hypothetical protein n=1 Tax=Nocardia takedensis TaxID=259390 RepID=UPI003F75BDD3
MVAEWCGALPTSRTLWRAFRAGAAIENADFLHWEIPKAAGGLVDAYRRHEAAYQEIARLSWSQAPEHRWPSVTSRFATACEEIAGFIVTLDLDSRELLGTPGPAGVVASEDLAAVIARQARLWVVTMPETRGPGRMPDLARCEPLMQQAHDYDELVIDLTSGRKCLPPPRPR